MTITYICLFKFLQKILLSYYVLKLISYDVFFDIYFLYILFCCFFNQFNQVLCEFIILNNLSVSLLESINVDMAFLLYIVLIKLSVRLYDCSSSLDPFHFLCQVVYFSENFPFLLFNFCDFRCIKL